MTNTDPEHWFLPARDIPRKPHYTSNNEVAVLIDGEAYFSHLSARLAGMEPGAYLHIAGYRLTPTIPLIPSTTPPGPNVIDLLVNLVARGIAVRVAVWYLPLELMTIFYRVLPKPRWNHHKDNLDTVAAINSAAAGTRGVSAAILDQRLPFPFPLAPTTFASHHQKNIIVKSGGHDWAYVGSIDIAVDRWDNSDHSSPPYRAKEYWDAYHDLQCVLRGPAVAQIWEHFKQRWNDTTPPTKSPSPLPIFVPPPIKDPPPAPASYGTQHVQVLRTLACRDVYPFARAGEQTARQGLERAIGAAEHYIYIEEQFLWPCSTVDELRDAVKKNPSLKVVILLAEELEFSGVLRVAHHEMRNEALTAIAGSSIGQVYVYCLEQPSTKSPIYVHSKLTIIDDCFVAIGSANMNKRSQTTDSEVHLSVVDGQIIPGTISGASVSVCRFAKELRIALWGEHLGITDPAKLEDPVASMSLWPDWSRSKPTAPSRVHHALCYHMKTETATLLEWLDLLKVLRTTTPLPPPWDRLLDLDDLITKIEQVTMGALRLSPPEILLGPGYITLKRFAKNFLMNIETTC